MLRHLLHGKRDHLLNQTRSGLVKQEHQVGSPTICISELQQPAHAQRLEFQDAQHGYIESRREQARLQEELSMKEELLQETPIRYIHELGEMKRAQELRVDEFSVQKIESKSRHNTETHFTIAVYARTNEFYERFRRIPGSGIESQWKIVSRSQSTSRDSKSTLHAATNACNMKHGMYLDYRKT